MEYIDDGEIHSIDDNYKYILRIFDDIEEMVLIDSDPILNEFINNCATKYSEYILKNHPEYVLNILIDKFKKENNFLHTNEDITFGFRPKWGNQKAHIYMKFKVPAN